MIFSESFILDFLGYIKHYQRDNPVKSRELEIHYNIRGADVRNIVRLLRRQGYWIGSTAGSMGGYWTTHKRGEYEESILSLRGRAMNILVTIREMKSSLYRVQTDQQQTELWEAIDVRT